VLVVVAGVSALAPLAKSAADGGMSTTPAVTSTTATTTTEPVPTEQDPAVLLDQVNRDIVKACRETWHWQRLMGRHTTPSHYRTDVPHSLPYAQRVLNLWQRRAEHWQSAARRWMHQRILTYRHNVGNWRLAMGQTGPLRTLAASGSLEERFRRWHKTAIATYRRVTDPPPSLSAWMCIHSGIKGGRWSRSLRYLGGGYKVSNGEGSWTDPGSPYWGGLQMDLTFQRTYGGWLLKNKGTADHWTPLEQIWAAVRAYRTRGFGPWPVTGHDCGLN
jgi:hypothetical protein